MSRRDFLGFFLIAGLISRIMPFLSSFAGGRASPKEAMFYKKL
jgi:hypothetical protein